MTRLSSRDLHLVPTPATMPPPRFPLTPFSGRPPLILGWYGRAAAALALLALARRLRVARFMTTNRTAQLLAVLAVAWRLVSMRRRQFTVSGSGRAQFEALNIGVERVDVTVRDGTVVQAYVLQTRTGRGAEAAGTAPKKLLLLANGLGCRYYYWLKLLKSLAERGVLDDYVCVTWDYRGLFASGEHPGSRTTFFSIRDHANDGLDVLSWYQRREGRPCFADEREERSAECSEGEVGSADADDQKDEDTTGTIIGTSAPAAAGALVGGTGAVPVIGWSTGVQVGLEMAGNEARAVESLVLINGAHGHLMHSFLQVGGREKGKKGLEARDR